MDKKSTRDGLLLVLVHALMGIAASGVCLLYTETFSKVYVHTYMNI